MKSQFVQKNIKLSLEFDKYASHNPKVWNKIPYGAFLIFTVSNDKDFNTWSSGLLTKNERNRKQVIEAHKLGNKWDVRKFEFV